MSKVFEGIKIADFSWLVQGPMTVEYLAAHGATVVHIESSSSVDVIRTSPPYKDNIPGINRSGLFPLNNCNKYGVTLNLNHPKGTEIAKRFVAWADIVAESFAPGTIERWGLDYESIRKIKPDIIMISLSIQGQTGPHAKHGAYGTQAVSLAGFTHLVGWPDRDPSLLAGAHTDVVAPCFAASALIAALDYRRRTGRGQKIDASQYECALQFLSPLILDYTVNKRVAERQGNLHPYAAPHGAYPCRGDDRWCAIAVFSGQEWEALCGVLGHREWVKDSRFATLLSRKQNENELNRLVSECTINFTAEKLMARLQAAGVSAGVVQNCKDILFDPQLQHRRHFWELEHSEIGKHTYDAPGFRLSKTPCELQMPAPCLGEHNEYVYTQILGLSDEEFVQLLGEGVFD